MEISNILGRRSRIIVGRFDRENSSEGNLRKDKLSMLKCAFKAGSLLFVNVDTHT